MERADLVLATDWSGGRLHAFAIENGALTPWGDGYNRPEGIAVRGDEALIAEQGGVLLRQDLLNPGRLGAVEVATGLGAPHAVAWSDDGASAQLTDRNGRLLAVDLGTGTVQTLAAGLAAPLGLAVGSAGEAYLTEQGTASIDRPGRHPDHAAHRTGRPLPAGLGRRRPQPAAGHRAGTVHRVGLVDVTDPAPVLKRLVGKGIPQPSQAIACRDRLVITGQNRLLSLDAAAGLEPGVRLLLPDEPLWPGAWIDVAIDTGVTGRTRADLDLILDPPGIVSNGARTWPRTPTPPVRPSGSWPAHSPEPPGWWPATPAPRRNSAPSSSGSRSARSP